MKESIQIRLTPEQAADPLVVESKARKMCMAPETAIVHIKKRSIDARQRKVMVQLSVDVYMNESPPADPRIPNDYPDVTHAPKVWVVGSGPAGLFAALELISQGFCPVILERGKDVRSRRRDLAAINKAHKVDPDSNYCFGEGGAGTYSDGKLYTRSGKRGNIREVLETFVAFGASPDILVDAHPHIGTNKLPGIITSIRQFIVEHGGEFHFNARVTNILIKDGRVHAVEVNGGERINGDRLILATGHSARDIYFMLHALGIELEAKPFAMGVRIEHPQSLIDNMQYHCTERGPYLPPASYAITRQANNRGVYSFCMCPGGIIAPCATAIEEVVTNGWSPSKRNNPFANSGFVVSLMESDFKAYAAHGPLAGLLLQAEAERKAWLAGGMTQRAPAQHLLDFISKRTGRNLPATSYQPGVTDASMDELLPAAVVAAMREALLQMKNEGSPYITEDAVMVGVESRTSSPVRIPRDPDTLCHPQVQGLYPCGEGAGYAGGIVSAAMDGIKVARMIAATIQS